MKMKLVRKRHGKMSKKKKKDKEKLISSRILP